MKLLTWTNFAFLILFISVIGLGIFVVRRPVEVFEEKQPDEAYIFWVSGTEYLAGDSFGQAIVEVQDYRGRPLNASCNLTMVYPNQTFVFIDALMSPSVLAGHYYKDFTVPNTFGIYVEWVNCSIQLRPNFNVTASKSNSFHVNPAFDYIIELGDNMTAYYNNITQQNEYIISLLENISIDIGNNTTYIENLIIDLRNNMTWNFNNTNYNITTFRNEAYTWYQILRTDIYNVLQRWIDELNLIIPRNIIQRLPTGGGVTQTNTPDWLRRIIGGD